MTPDPSLVERVRAGDPIGFELIMRRYNQRLYRLARGIVKNGSEAEDVVQEAYVRAYEKLNDFIGPDGFSAWLGKIVVNEALGRLRKRGRVISLDDYVKGGKESADVRHIDTMKTQQPDPERLAASSELRRVLEQAIEALPDDFRSVFILRAVEGMKRLGGQRSACRFGQKRSRPDSIARAECFRAPWAHSSTPSCHRPSCSAANTATALWLLFLEDLARRSEPRVNRQNQPIHY